MIFGIIIGISFVLYGIQLIFQNVKKIVNRLKEESPQNDNDKAE